MTFTPYGGVAPLQRQAATAIAGFTLINGTPSVISWTVPNDGQQHRVAIFAVLAVTSLETGGVISLTLTTIDGSVQVTTLIQGGLAVGQYAQNQGGSAWIDTLVAPGSTVTIAQFSALTAGAAKLWAEIWGS